MRFVSALMGVVCISHAAGAALAQQVSVGGTFTAVEPCEVNKRKDSVNPGGVRLTPGVQYAVIARNSTPGTHYLIRVPGAPEPETRWAPMTCGTWAAAAGEAPGGQGGGPAGRLEPDSIEAVLAASWQPGFCATPNGRNKEECRTQTAARFDATNFSIHGLWPDDLDNTAIFPCYCDDGGPISCGASRSGSGHVTISAPVLERLREAMPGVMSGLHDYEWAKHGSCYEDDRTDSDAGADPDEYFRGTMALLAALNGSAVADLFRQNLGQVLSSDEIEDAFDTAFGPGAGDRVLVRCADVDGEPVITELWIGLKGDISEASDLKQLIQAAPTAERASTQRTCSEGRVVEVTR